MRVLDLFSGIGAYALGLQRAGFDIVSFCEKDEWCRKLLAANFPEVPCFHDITTADFSLIEAEVIIGGFPCQDISRAGKRAGISGARSGLFWEMVRAISVVRPLYVIVENVAALLDRAGGMGVVLGALAQERYDAEWDCISLNELGAPHGRPRLWLTATNRDRAKRPQRSGKALRRGEWIAQEVGETTSNSDRSNARKGQAIPVSRGQRISGSGQEAFADPNGERKLQPPWVFGNVRRWISNGDVGAFWSGDWEAKFEAFRRMDVRPPTRLDRTRDSRAIGHIGNCNPPQIPEIIGRAIMEAETMGQTQVAAGYAVGGGV